MNRIALHIATHPLYPAFRIGLLMGAVAWGLLHASAGSGFGLAMALVVVSSGTASYVCLCLARRTLPAGRVRRQAVRAWVVAIGLGMLAALGGLDALLGA
ncbi:hypothetical protein V4F39_24805 [Aquincola sp. MAHUQ-54]|uniref:Uncharacterized protein n=1 Tax=Aquincola agrisoli TaxID=3119538 RepID=A0AAW9QNE1_9BURK